MVSSDSSRVLRGFPIIHFEARVYRHVHPRRECTSGEGALSFGGRWNPPGSFPAVYTALTETGVRDELVRAAGLQGTDVDGLLPRKICIIGLRLSGVVDLARSEELSLLGLTSEHLRSDDFRRCQQVGAAAHELSLEAILVPSAAGAETNLVVFPLNLSLESRMIEEGTETWAALEDLPAS